MSFGRRTPAQKEWEAFLKHEKRAAGRYDRRREALWEKRLSSLIPEGLSQKLEAAFEKAFRAVLTGGTGLIEKTYSRERLELEYQARDYKTGLIPTRKHIRENSRIARRQRTVSTVAAGVEGAGLGLLGIGIPDIPLFLAALFRNLYKLCLHYGIDYERPEEKELLLEMIALSLYQGEDFQERDAALNRRLYGMAVKDWKKKEKPGKEGDTETDGEKQGISSDAVREAARALSGELLYLKFLQGIAIVGVIGGACGSIYMSRISKYVSLKLERRYLLRLIISEEGGPSAR